MTSFGRTKNLWCVAFISLYGCPGILTCAAAAPIPTTTTVSVSLNPVFVGQQETVTSNVLSDDFTSTPTGTVQFSLLFFNGTLR